MSREYGYEVIVVGAGLAGLRCAQVLNNAGRSVLLIDKNQHLGGRLHSYRVDEYVIDEGFQLINPSYPELIKSGVLEGFDLRTFDRAIKFVGGDDDFMLADPRKFPLQALTGFRNSPLSTRDGLALAQVLLRARVTSVKSIMNQPDTSTREGLLNAGISESVIDTILVPFLRGTFLDDKLETSWQYAQMVLKSFTKASPGTHPEGIEALAKAFLPKLKATTVRLNTRVESLNSHEVVTAEGTYTARQVVLASDGDSANLLLGSPIVDSRPQTTWWWSLPGLESASTLRIDLDDRLLSSALDLSSRAPERSPVGRSLVATPMNGERPTTDLEVRARASVARMYGLALNEIEIVATTVVNNALPVTNPGLHLRSGLQINGVYCAGDYLETPSIQGALASGAKTAREILQSGVF